MIEGRIYALISISHYFSDYNYEEVARIIGRYRRVVCVTHIWGTNNYLVEFDYTSGGGGGRRYLTWLQEVLPEDIILHRAEIVKAGRVLYRK